MGYGRGLISERELRTVKKYLLELEETGDGSFALN
jgi:hypothetical protein